MKRQLKIGQFEVPPAEYSDEWNGWEIVNEVGVGRWIGKVLEEKPSARVLTLQPALQLSCPAAAPVMRMGAAKQLEMGQAIGLFAQWVLDQPSDHPIRDIAYSSRQRVSEMSEDLRHYIHSMIGDAVRRSMPESDDPNLPQ